MREGLSKGNPVVNGTNSLCRLNAICSCLQVLAGQDGHNTGSEAARIFSASLRKDLSFVAVM